MSRVAVARILVVLFLCSVLPAADSVPAEEGTPFRASALVKLGDTIRYGSYLIKKIGEGIYQIDDRSEIDTGRASPQGDARWFGVCFARISHKKHKRRCLQGARDFARTICAQ